MIRSSIQEWTSCSAGFQAGPDGRAARAGDDQDGCHRNQGRLYGPREVPGVKKENINVEIEGNEVTITAEVKKEWEKKEGDKILRSERYFGNVYRSFTLPYDLDETKSVAKYDGGVLELKLVKKAGVAGRKLPVM
jgi:hypothetical protein